MSNTDLMAASLSLCHLADLVSLLSKWIILEIMWMKSSLPVSASHRNSVDSPLDLKTLARIRTAKYACKQVWSIAFHLSQKTHLPSKLVQTRMSFWMVSGMKSSKEDFMSCTWVTAIGPRCILITLEALGQENHSISPFFDIHICPPLGCWLADCWQAGAEAGYRQAGLAGCWQVGWGSVSSSFPNSTVRLWIDRNVNTIFWKPFIFIIQSFFPFLNHF